MLKRKRKSKHIYKTFGKTIVYIHKTYECISIKNQVVVKLVHVEKSSLYMIISNNYLNNRFLKVQLLLILKKMKMIRLLFIVYNISYNHEPNLMEFCLSSHLCSTIFFRSMCYTFLISSVILTCHPLSKEHSPLYTE